jgi:hypothetical protein
MAYGYGASKANFVMLRRWEPTQRPCGQFALAIHRRNPPNYNPRVTNANAMSFLDGYFSTLRGLHFEPWVASLLTLTAGQVT